LKDFHRKRRLISNFLQYFLCLDLHYGRHDLDGSRFKVELTNIRLAKTEMWMKEI